MKLRFRPDALRDLEEIRDYIAEDSPAAAARLIGLLGKTCAFLADNPYAGLADNPYAGRVRPELWSDLRSFPARRYVIFYRLLGDTLEIVDVVHGSRDIEAMF
jgi:toxin ParE1/3/4